MGLYAESAQVYREVQAAVARGEPNYAPVVGLLARLGLGESLLLDLRLPEARRELLTLEDAASASPALALRAHQLLARGEELAADPAAALLAQARRLREARDAHGAASAYRSALARSPRSAEAALGAAEDDLDHGRLDAARKALHGVEQLRSADPPWLEPWSWLLQARAHDLAGERASALAAYAKVRDAPLGRDDLRQAAAAGLAAPFLPSEAGEPSAATR
jgi:thioredoxin-like negative regulator of GroEL